MYIILRKSRLFKRYIKKQLINCEWTVRLCNRVQKTCIYCKFYEESFKSVRIHRACMKFKKKIINFHHSTARRNFSQNLSDSSAVLSTTETDKTTPASLCQLHQLCNYTLVGKFRLMKNRSPPGMWSSLNGEDHRGNSFSSGAYASGTPPLAVARKKHQVEAERRFPFQFQTISYSKAAAAAAAAARMTFSRRDISM